MQSKQNKDQYILMKVRYHYAFQLLISFLTSVLLLETKVLFRIVMPLSVRENRASAHPLSMVHNEKA
jgi:hypothetical protein